VKTKTDIATALAADHNRTVSEQAKDLLGSLIQKEQYVGEVFSIDYEEATVEIHDHHRKDVGGIPGLCFLIATRMGPDDTDIDYTLEDTSVILLRVMDAAPLPNDQEALRIRAEAAQRAAGEETKHCDHAEMMDPQTHNILSFAGLKCRVVGTFFLDKNAHGDLALKFGSDISNFYPNKGLKVYKPNGQALQKIVNHRDFNRDDLASAEEVEVGEVRYASTNRTFQGVSDVKVRLTPGDLLGQKTALFGITRIGKSNTTKIIAQSVFALRWSAQLRIGQVIFDPDGEYANENVQDAGGTRNPSALKNVWRSHPSGKKDDVVTYGILEHPNDPDRRLMLLNFYDDATLQIGKEIINSALHDEGGVKYIRNFRDVRFDHPDPADQSAGVRYRRRRLAYRALLARAGFVVPAALRPDPKGLFNHKLIEALKRGKGQDPAAYQAAASILDKNDGTASWSAIGDPMATLYEFMKDSNSEYDQFERDYLKEKEQKGEEPQPWADEDLKKILEMFAYTNGPKIVGHVRAQHTNTLTGDYADQIYNNLVEGRLVIIDQSGGDEAINRSVAERVMWRIFQENQTDFRTAKRPPEILVYVEEAHELLPSGSENDLTNVWVRAAKEGGKYRIGMVYADQEVSSIQRNIRTNTANWFIGHLNNNDETKELRKFYDFADFESSILRAQDKGFLRMKTLSNPFTVPVQILKFEIPV